MKLIKNANIFAPEEMGLKNIIIAFDRILMITDELPSYEFEEVYDAAGKILIPGIVDQHVHITGGGGEGGFKTRVPEIQLSHLIKAGITTVVGLLGTDATTRSVENLVAKAKALTSEGIETYALTGAYEVPSPSLTGSMKKDLVFIDSIIGIKVAANDHRDSAISAQELARIASEARVGGMISGKSGHVTVHMGGGKFLLNQIRQALKLSNLPITIFRPTHVNRNKDLFEDSLAFAMEGGYIDATCGMSIPDSEVFMMAKESGVLDRLTFSSDGFGSWSRYDQDGNLLEIGYSPLNTALTSIREMLDLSWSLSDILPAFTSNVARALKLSDIGEIKEGYKANMLILDADFTLESVMSQGVWMMKDGILIKKGTFESI